MELTEFRASCGAEAGTAELSWGTASEKSNARFEVQRSYDGKRFERLSFVAGVGTSSQARSYSYRDQGASTGRRYYRLRQVDQDGTESFSLVQSVSCLSSPASVTLAYPNPVHDELNLPADVSEVRLLDATGRPVLRYQPQADGAPVLKLRTLPAGLYRLELRRTDGQLLRQPVAVE